MGAPAGLKTMVMMMTTALPVALSSVVTRYFCTLWSNTMIMILFWWQWTALIFSMRISTWLLTLTSHITRKLQTLLLGTAFIHVLIRWTTDVTLLMNEHVQWTQHIKQLILLNARVKDVHTTYINIFNCLSIFIE